MSTLTSNQPPQPTKAEAYTAPGNPSTKTPHEQAESAVHALDSSSSNQQQSYPIPQRQAADSQASPQPQARGIHGAPAGEESKGLTEEDVGRHRELDGEQMAVPGEGRVADAVAGRGKSLGGGGEQPDLAADLDKKKAEQAEAREAVKKERGLGKDVVGGGLGQRGGPAGDAAIQGNSTNDGIGS